MGLEGGAAQHPWPRRRLSPGQPRWPAGHPSLGERDERVVAQHCSITFLRPGKLGDRLSAHAVERSRTGRSGIYDIRVTDAQGAAIAEFRGHSRSIGGRLLEDGDQGVAP